MSVNAIFGAAGKDIPPALVKIYDETKEGDNVNYSEVTLEPSGVYLYFRVAWTISTGKYYGAAAYLRTTPSADAFDSNAPSAIELGSGGSSGVSTTVGNSGLFKWRCSGTAYRVRVIIYKLV